MPIQRAHDKFYTCAATARLCTNALLARELPSGAIFLEPAAGAGAFLTLLPAAHRIGIDIAPAHPEIRCENFLTFDLPSTVAGRHVVVVGNPPFGRNASLACKFFNKAAGLSDVIAFIVPKTFQKAHTVRRLDKRFRLVDELALPDSSFMFEGKQWHVPCVFQIWEKCGVPRDDVAGPLSHPDFDFVTREFADFAVRRVGRSAGAVFENFSAFATRSHHFLKAARAPAVMNRLRTIDWSALRGMTAGVPCVGKEELIRHYSAALAHRVGAD